MHPRVVTSLRALTVVAVPLLLIGNMLWVLAQSWLVHVLYAAPGIPVAVPALSDRDQVGLARAGVDAIQPAGDGVEPLRAARLPDGAAAFTSREVAHMADVATVVGVFVVAWAIAAVVVAAAALTSRGRDGRAGLLRSLTRGGWLTLVLVAVVAVGMLVSFDAFFVAFHGVFFEGDSWRFGDDALLLKLYPERFWVLAGALATLLVLLQAVGLIALGRRLGRRTADRRASGEPSRRAAATQTR